MNKNTKTILLGVGLSVAAAFAVIAFIFWTIVPQFQGREYLKKAAVAYTPEVIINDTFIFEPMTADQGLIRYLLVSALIRKFSDEGVDRPDRLFDHAVMRLEEYIERFPLYYDYYLALGKAYELQAILNKDASYSRKAEEQYATALTLAPGRPDAVYAAAFNVLAQGREEEALTRLRAFAESQPEIADTHYQIAQVLMVIGKDRYNEALGTFEYALDHGANMSPSLTVNMYQKLFYQYYHAGDFARLRTTVKRLSQIDTTQSVQYLKVLEYMDKNGAAPRIDIQIPTN